jgi:hypothetical protein
VLKDDAQGPVLKIETVQFVDQLPTADLFFGQRRIEGVVKKVWSRHLAIFFTIGFSIWRERWD